MDTMRHADGGEGGCDLDSNQVIHESDRRAFSIHLLCCTMTQQRDEEACGLTMQRKSSEMWDAAKNAHLNSPNAFMTKPRHEQKKEKSQPFPGRVTQKNSFF